MERLTRQKINKKSEDLNNNIDQLITVIYRTLHGTIAEHTFFSSVHGTFSSVDKVLGHVKLGNKSYKFKSTEIIPNIFSDHKG